MKLRSAGVLVASSFALMFAACESVPNLQFIDADAAALADGSHDGAAPDAEADGAGMGEGGLDGTIADTGTDTGATCTAPQPAGGGTCCGDVWCVGMCNPANCSACAAKGCAATDVCCGKMGTVVCKATCP